MLIREAKAIYREQFAGDENIRGAGIRDCRRHIIVFIDKKQYDNERRGINDPLKSKIGLAFQINLSIADGRGSFSFLGKGPNSSYIRMNVYSYDVLFETTYTDLSHALFTLRSAYGSEIYRDYNAYDNPEKISNVSIYNKMYNGNDSATLMYDSFFTDSATIVLPEYYSTEHMAAAMDDYFSVIEYGNIYSTIGEKLVDRATDIKFMDVSAFSTIERVIRGIYDEHETKTQNDSELVTREMFTTVAPSMLDGTVFIYDTDEGTNIKGGTVPFLNCRDRKSIISDLSFINDSLKFECKRIEESHGPIRAFFTPSLYGDRIKIIVKDDPTTTLAPSLKIDRDFTSFNALDTLLDNFNYTEG